MDLSYAQIKRLYKKEKVQILCRCVSVDSTGHVFADMKLKGVAPLMILSVRLVGHKNKGNQNRKREALLIMPLITNYKNQTLI